MKKINETEIKKIADGNMDKYEVLTTYEGVPNIWAKVLIRRVIKNYADAYGDDFKKMYAKVRCESKAIETIMTSVPYATCPDWFGDYFDKVYSEEISQR